MARTEHLNFQGIQQCQREFFVVVVVAVVVAKSFRSRRSSCSMGYVDSMMRWHVDLRRLKLAGPNHVRIIHFSKRLH